MRFICVTSMSADGFADGRIQPGLHPGGLNEAVIHPQVFLASDFLIGNLACHAETLTGRVRDEGIFRRE
jgi:hypothetical protein